MKQAIINFALTALGGFLMFFGVVIFVNSNITLGLVTLMIGCFILLAAILMEDIGKWHF